MVNQLHEILQAVLSVDLSEVKHDLQVGVLDHLAEAFRRHSFQLVLLFFIHFVGDPGRRIRHQGRLALLLQDEARLQHFVHQIDTIADESEGLHASLHT